MKKLILFLFFIISIDAFSQTLSKRYNELYQRWEFVDKNRKLVQYAKYNSLRKRWEYFSPNNKMIAYSRYNSLTKETELVYVENNTHNSYGSVESLFDPELAYMVLKYKQEEYDKIMEIYNNLTPEQKKKVDEYLNARNKRKLYTYAKPRKDEEGTLFKNTLGLKYIFDEFTDKRYEFMYQRRTGKFSRIEFSFGYIEETSDGGLSYESLRFGTSYQWVAKLVDNTNFYFGLGVVAKKIETKNNFFEQDNLEGIFGLASLSIGFEYNFKIPLVLYIDYDFALSLLPSGGLDDSGLGVGIRYGFN